MVLAGAGIAFTQQPADVDEAAVKATCAGRGMGAEETALALAAAKAEAAAARLPGAVVIGADQVLECGGRTYDKPADADAARRHLKSFRGRSHDLVSAVAVCTRAGETWRHVERARLTMRDFSDAFLEGYLERAGAEILESVGAYRLEGEGAQLFSAIEGDYFTILGLPLLPLLEFLRGQKLIER